jgi:N-acylneuraminate cytidylyltransferase
MIIAFIPLRCGSKSIKFKNIKDFCGKPLCYWNIEALEKSKVDEIIIATDCDEIKKIIESFNFSKVKVYYRKEENTKDTSSTESVMLEYLHHNKNYSKNDIFMLVQATSPLTETKDFNEAIEQYFQNKFDSLLTCVRTKRFFWDSKGNSMNYDYYNRPRRQEFDGCFMENGAFYITTIDKLLQNQNRLSGHIGIYEMKEYKGIEIDEPIDWTIAEILMKNYQSDRIKTSIYSIKLFASDIDGTLTDGGMYYYENGEEGKKFNTIDGKGFEILRTHGIKTAILTGETSDVVEKRAKKLKIDYLYMGLSAKDKLEKLLEICKLENISLSDVAYIGDDINCQLVLEAVGIKACPSNAHKSIKEISGIINLSKSGGNGAVREFIDNYLIQ